MKIRSSGLLAAVLMCAAVLSGCSKADQQPPPPKAVKLGFLPITADVSLFVAIEKQMFAGEGVTVEAIRFPDANQAMNALLTGDIEGAVMIGYSTLITIFSKSPEAFRVVQSGAETEDKFTARIIVPTNSLVQKVEELKGKTIGTYAGATQRLNLVLVLAHFFQNPDESVQIMQVESSLQLPSLSAGRFDALFTIDPQATIAIKNGIGRSISDSPRAKYIVNPFPTAATIFSKEFIESRPSEAAKVLKALEAATAWVEMNRGAAARITANQKYTDVSEEIVAACGTYEWWNLGQEIIKPVQKLADIMYEHDLLKSAVRVQGMFADPTVLKPSS